MGFWHLQELDAYWWKMSSSRRCSSSAKLYKSKCPDRNWWNTIGRSAGLRLLLYLPPAEPSLRGRKHLAHPIFVSLFYTSLFFNRANFTHVFVNCPQKILLVVTQAPETQSFWDLSVLRFGAHKEHVDHVKLKHTMVTLLCKVSSNQMPCIVIWFDFT